MEVIESPLSSQGTTTASLRPLLWPLLLLSLLWLHEGIAGAAEEESRLGRDSRIHHHQFAAMGTRFGVKVHVRGAQDAELTAALKELRKRVDELEAVFSDYDAESEVMRLSRQPVGKPVRVSGDLLRVLRLSGDLWKRSGGAFDVTAGRHTWNWRMTRKTGQLPDRTSIDAAKQATGFSKLGIDVSARTVTLKETGMRLDFGGIAKGVAADEALAILKKRGFARAIVMAGGDVAAGSPPPGEPGWRVGIRSLDGKEGKLLPGHLLLKDSAVSTSGDLEQFLLIDGKRYSHIVDPSTGLGLTRRIAATTLSRSAALSDACATVACILGPEKGLAWIQKQPGVEALVVSQPGGKVVQRKTRAFPEMIVDGAQDDLRPGKSTSR